jgi:hypothetical protein
MQSEGTLPNTAQPVPTRHPLERMTLQQWWFVKKVKDSEYVCIQVLSFIGVLGNVVVLLVVGRSPSNIPHVYMWSLAVADLVISICSAWKINVERFNYISDAVYKFSARTYWPVVSLDHGASMAASLLSMLLSVDRCFALKYPLKHRKVWSVRKVKILAAVVTVLSVVVSLHKLLQFYVHFPGRIGAYIIDTRPTPLGNNKHFSQACAYTEFLLRFAIPLLTMTVSNTWTLAIIQRSDAFRKKLDDKSHTRKTPKCLAITVGLVVIFFCTQLLYAVVLVDGMVFGIEHRGTLALEVTYCVSNILRKINSDVNVFVYLALSQEFRCTLLTIARCASPSKSASNEVGGISVVKAADTDTSHL